MIDMRKYGQALAFEVALELSIVSFGPWLLRMVINPSAAMACPLLLAVVAINAMKHPAFETTRWK
jgi:hypothetical protein